MLQLLFLPFFPESPRYLLIQKKDEAAAKSALRRLRGWHDVDAEIEEILQEDKAEKAAGFISVLKLFKMRSLRWQVISIIVLMAGQQLSGVNAVGSRCWGWGWSSAWTTAGAGDTPRRPGRGLAGLTSVSFQIYYYADQIYLSAGVNEDNVQFVTVGTGAVNVLITVCAIFIVELIGRRFLLLLGFSVCFTACSVLTGALVLQVRKAGPGVQPSVWALLCMLIITMSQLLGVSPPPAPATHCSFTVDIPEACRWRCLLKKVPGALLPNSGRATGPLGDKES